MPIPLLACLVAVVAAGGAALLTPTLLRWFPSPPDGTDLPPFSELGSLRFRLAVFLVGAVAGWIAASLTQPSFWGVWIPFTSLGALLALIDLRTTFLPLRLNYLMLGLVAAGAVLAAALQADWTVFAWTAGGGVGAAGLFWLVYRISGEGLGFGDVRLAGLIGTAAGTGGLPLLMWSLLLGTTAGAVWGLVLRLRRGRDGGFPYGPALMLGPILALLARTWLG